MSFETTYAKIMRFCYSIRGFGYLPIAENTRRRCVQKYVNKPESERYATINDYWGSLKMHVDRASYMGSNIYWKGRHQHGEIRFVQSILQPNMVFVDMGANQGEFTVVAASLLPQGQVMSFEPLASIRRDLEKNIALNGFKNVQVYACGVSDKVGEVPIYTSSDTTRQQSFHEGLGTLYKTDYRSEQIDVIKLRKFDDIFEESGLKRLDMIKLDIEGSELYALQGAEKTIRAYKPRYILVELNYETSNAAGYELKTLLQFVENMGYQWHQLSKHGQLKGTNTVAEIEAAAADGIDAVAVLK
jgi:FkbM family methyltransferase